MVEGRTEGDWERLRCMMALVANCHRGRGRPLVPDDFKVKVIQSDEDLRKVFE